MASLITNLQNNNAIPPLNNAPQYKLPAQPPQVGLSPEAKSSLLAGVMSGVLGGVWGAPSKFDAKTLINLEKDTFDKATKTAQKKLPEQFNKFIEIKNYITDKTNTHINHFFGESNELNKKDILKKLGVESEASLEKSIIELEEELLQAAEAKTPLIKVKDKLELLEQKKVGMHYCDIAIDETISKKSAIESTKDALYRENLNQIETCFENIKSKLPKKRFKTAAKWFGLAIVFSIIMNGIFATFRNIKNKK